MEKIIVASVHHNHLVLQGIITAPILFAMEEFPQLHAVVYQGFDNPENIDIVSIWYLPIKHYVFLLMLIFYDALVVA